MRIVFLLSLLCTLNKYSYAQSGPPPGPGGQGFKQTADLFASLGDVLPAAPNAASLGKYGGVDVDLGSGMINRSIALRKIIDRGITIPVTLNYQSAGLKVNEYPSRVGMGWRIYVGGQISRIIRGKDDLVATRTLPNSILQPNEDEPVSTTYAYNIINTPIDAEPDLFNFSFGEYTGKFIFDNEGNITPLSASTLKFLYNNTSDNTWKFKIIAADGSTYVFGGTHMIEETKNGGGKFSAFKNTAWCLNKIIHADGYEMNFLYEMVPTGGWISDRHETNYKLSADADDPLCVSIPTSPPPNIICIDGTLPPLYVLETTTNANIRLLKEIQISTGAKVLFNYTVAGYPENLVNEIIYKNENDQQVQKYSFHYTLIPSFTGTIPFLNNIKEYGINNIPLHAGHTFHYINTTSFPRRVNFSQDHWGYYNGKSNTTLIPVPEDEEMALQFPYATANRNADPAFAKIGLLEKIEYPTGGYDMVEYEPNIAIQTKDVNPYSTIAQNITGTGNFEIESAGSLFTIGYDGRVKIYYKTEKIGTGDLGPHDYGMVKITNVQNNNIVFSEQITVNAPAFTVFRNLPAGTYRLTVVSRGINIYTVSNLKYRPGTAANYQEVDVEVGGMRVKKITTYDGVSASPLVKRLYYGTISNLNKSSGTLVQMPNYYTPYNYTVTITINLCNDTYERTYYHQVLQSDAVNKFLRYDGSVMKYTSVIESIGGDNFENGAIEHKFHFASDLTPLLIRGLNNSQSSFTNTSYLTKGETETIYYSLKSGVLTQVKKNKYEYTFDPRKDKTTICYNINKTGMLPCTSWNGNIITGPAFVHKAFQISRYHIYSSWKYLSKLIVEEYDENGSNPKINTTNYYYDDDRNLMLSREIIQDSKGQTFKRTSKFTHDFAGTAVYDAMISKNMIENMIEEKTEKMVSQNVFTELNKKRVNYNFFNSNTLIKTQTIQSSNNGYSLETAFTAEKYDSKGNLLEVIPKNGVRTVYLWGYNQQYPVAKISNKTYNEVINQTNINFTLLSNPSSDNQLRSHLSQLRNIANAQAQTYTYKPMVGVSSETNINGVNTFYTYDNYNRLSLLIDHQNKVLKKYCYKYTGQQEECSTQCVDNPNWQNTGATGCETGSCGYTGNTTAEQIDTNPCSSTYNTTQWVVTGYNSSICQPGSCVQLTSTMTFPLTGYAASYFNTSTNVTYTFPVTASGGLQPLGNLPAGNYTLTISRITGTPIYAVFKSGCKSMAMSGNSATFYNVAVSATTCNSIIIEAYLEM